MVAELVGSPLPTYQGKLYSTALARPPKWCHLQEAESALSLSCNMGLFTFTHASRTSSTVLPRQEVGPTSPNAADCEGLGLPQPVIRTSSIMLPR